MATSADVPHRFDVVINSQGYLLLDSFQDDANAPQKAVYGYTPAFLPRTNVEGQYGDNQQDFWMTYSQKDWSLGQNQKYQGRTDEARRRYWEGSHVDVLVPGQVTLQPGVDSVTFTEATESLCYVAGQSAIALGGTTNLYTLTADGTETDKGAHGLGTAPARWGMASDGTGVYMTSEETGTVGVRRWNGSAFSTFSATGSSALAYLNNTLYGLDKNGILRRYSTAGTASTLHTWQQGEGTAVTLGTKGRLAPFGGKLLILLDAGMQTPELWIWDGVGVSKLAAFSANFTIHGLEVLNGVAFISGHLKQSSASVRPVVYYYANGSIGKLWEAEDFGSVGIGSPDLASFNEKLVFNDAQEGKILVYNPETGGISSLGPYAASADLDSIIGAADSFLVVSHGGGGSTFQTPALVQSVGKRDTDLTSPQTIAWHSPTTDGNLLLMSVNGFRDDATAPTFTTPSGWTLVGTQTYGAGASEEGRISLYKIQSATSRSGSEGLTWAGGAVDGLTVQMFEYSGVGVEDVTEATAEGTGTTASTGTTGTTTQNDELWFAFIGYATSNEALSNPTNGFESVRAQIDISGGISQEAFAKVVSATGTASMSATVAVSAHWAGMVATFKAKAEGEGYLFPSSSRATGGNITSSLIDFDSSLDKMFRGITVDFVSAEDGDGGSVDISYRVNGQDAEPEELQSDADSGTEYTFDDETGRSLSATITLNKGTSTDGPILKRVYVRAAPLTNVYKRRRYTLNCTGKDHESTIIVRDGTSHTKDGLEMATDLQTAAESQSPLTIIDKMGSFTGVIEELELIEVRPEEFVARVLCREV